MSSSPSPAHLIVSSKFTFPKLQLVRKSTMEVLVKVAQVPLWELTPRRYGCVHLILKEFKALESLPLPHCFY